MMSIMKDRGSYHRKREDRKLEKRADEAEDLIVAELVEEKRKSKINFPRIQSKAPAHEK